jgi:hypothetical protein
LVGFLIERIHLKMTSESLAARIVARVLSADKTVKVKNKDTGSLLWKTPEAIRKNRDKYQVVPQPSSRSLSNVIL